MAETRRAGELLGKGLSLDEALGSTVMVAEGVRATRMFAARTQAENIPAPFVQLVAPSWMANWTSQTCIRRMLQIGA